MFKYKSKKIIKIKNKFTNKKKSKKIQNKLNL